MEREHILQWLENQNYIDELSEYVANKSRSNFSQEVSNCAQFAESLLLSAGLKTQILQTRGNPIVYGERLTSPNNKTILFYGHYDVQPEGDLEEWNTEPFTACLIGDKLYGRGTADNKGQHYAHILAIRYLKDNFPEILDNVNIKFILDGDEERGSFSLVDAFESIDLSADLIIVSDGPSLTTDRPSIVGSVRGILTFQIRIRHNNEDLHSGNFGGLARSATRDLINLIDSMVDESGRAKIPGFYNDVISPSEFENNLLEILSPVFEEIISSKKITPAKVQEGKSRILQNQFLPTFNINGLRAGGVGVERRTIIPQEAIASIDCRLVPNQDSSHIQALIKNFVHDWATKESIEDAITIEFEHAMEPSPSSFSDPLLKILETSLEQGFQRSPLLVPRLGGSLPIYLFPKYLGQNVFLIPYALPDENNHAPNENLDIPYFKSGVCSSVFILSNLSTQ